MYKRTNNDLQNIHIKLKIEQHEWGMDGIVITTNLTYSCCFVIQIFRNGYSSHGYERKSFEVMT